MEPLVGFWSYFWMLTAAAVAGAIGGFAFEIMPAHSQCHMGAIRTPHRLRVSHSFDLGFLSNLLLGAVTSVAVLYFFPPETQTIVKQANGIPQTNYSYDLVKLVALSLIVGSAGPSFLSSIQGRLAGALYAQRETLARKTQEELDKVNENAGTTVTTVAQEKKRQVEETLRMKMHSQTAAVASVGNNGKEVMDSDKVAEDLDKYVESTINEIHSICDNAAAEVQRQIQTSVENAKKAINKEMGLD